MQSSTNQKHRKPELQISWDPRRAWHPDADINRAFKKATPMMVLGIPGSGKSSLLETLAFHYPKVIDLFGSRDNEGLGWIRSPFGKKVLFLKGKSVSIDCNCADVKDITDVKLADFENYKVILACSCFFSSLQEEWYGLAKFVDKLWYRESWTEPWALMVREAANLLYSRVALGDNQYMAKNYMIYVMREMRHQGYALCVDALRSLDIDIDIRTLAFFTFIKALGIEGLKGYLRFVYAYYNANNLMSLDQDRFVVLHNRGPLGCGSFNMPYWHKQEYENLRTLFDIRIKTGETPHIPGSGSAQVGDYEHIRIIKARIETGFGMNKLAEELGRSSRTIKKNIDLHDNMIRMLDQCDACARVNGEYKRRATS